MTLIDTEKIQLFKHQLQFMAAIPREEWSDKWKEWETWAVGRMEEIGNEQS